MRNFFASLVLIITLASCKKDSADVCYECKDAAGQNIGTFCGSSEQEAFDKSGTINGFHIIDSFRRQCPKKP